MNASFCFAICSVFYIILIMIMFFSKERLKNTENKIYSILIIVNLVGLLFEISSTLLEMTGNSFSFIHILLLKLIMLYYLTWIYVFFVYTYYISKNNNKFKLNKFVIFYTLLAVATLLLPLGAEVSNGLVAYTYGASVNFVYGLSGILILACIILMLRNFKNIKKRKYVPLLAFIFVGIIIGAVQFIFPTILLMSSLETLITVLMFFTIENPDVQMLRELYKNKKLIEKSNEDTSKFLFRVTQDIRKPVKDVIDISYDMKNMQTKENLISAGQYINSYANQIDYLINKALNISSMDTQKIKVFENKYNVINLFKEISFRTVPKMNSKTKFEYTIANNIPEYLYGDAIKLKQAITSLLKRSIDDTDSGFISLDISSMVKYNICRLFITIEDSGKGMDIDQVNEILSLKMDDLNEINVNNLEDSNLNLKSIKKIVNILGGSLMIKSEVDNGTTFIITLDQKIVESQETEMTKRLDKYEQSLYGDKHVLVIDTDEKALATITSLLEKEEMIVSSSVYGRDCLEKIRAKMKYDLIILNDDLGELSALTILQELQKNKNFKTPVVVMINDNKEGIKLHYMKDGFAECIMKSKLESEVSRIIKRF